MNDSVAASRLHSCVKLIFETCNSARYKPNFRERVMNER